MNKIAKGRDSWDNEVTLSPEAKECLAMWSRELQQISFEAPLQKKS